MHKVYPLGSSSYTQQYLHKRYTAYLHSTRNVLSCGFLRLLAACKSPGTFSLPLFYFESVTPQKNDLKKRRKGRKKTQVIYMSIQILSLWFFFFFWVLRKPQKIHPSFCVHMNGKVKQSSEKSKKKRKSFRFYQWQKIHIVFWWILFQSVHQLVLGDDRCFNELLH